ncbi:MAG: TatD family hydrolase [Desulfurivibrio sp.]|nr:TatD family hydrolase [Desulfurivibrio sp.]
MSAKIAVNPPVVGDNASLIDTHCHLDFPDYAADYDDLLERARRVGVEAVITVGIDLATSRQAVALAAGTPERGPRLYATVGVHPHHVGEMGAEDYRHLRELAAEPAVVAYGEIGLDYVKEYSPAARQRQAFAEQLALAGELALPVIIHDREAHADTLAILKEAGNLPAGGVMHCFSGDAALAEEVLALGFYISIPGVVTFKNAAALRQAVSRVPLKRLLLETDGPFLAPEPYRGKRNEPAWLAFTAARVAEVKGVSLEEVARHTTANAKQLFGVD